MADYSLSGMFSGGFGFTNPTQTGLPLSYSPIYDGFYGITPQTPTTDTTTSTSESLLGSIYRDTGNIKFGPEEDAYVAPTLEGTTEALGLTPPPEVDSWQESFPRWPRLFRQTPAPARR